MKYNWRLFKYECELLAKKFEQEQFTHMLVLERGGSYVARELLRWGLPGIRVIPIHVSFYDGQELRDMPIVKYPNGYVFKKTDKVVVVDDLIESGKSINFIRNSFLFKNKPYHKVAVLNIKKDAPIKADYYIHDNVNEWIIHPFENDKDNHAVALNYMDINA